MLRIKIEQVRLLESQLDRRFRLKLSRFLEEHCGADRSRRTQLNSEIESALADARSFGLRNERTLAMYTLAAFRCGLTIREDPQIRATMSLRSMSETAKADWLVDWLVALEKALETPDVR